MRKIHKTHEPTALRDFKAAEKQIGREPNYENLAGDNAPPEYKPYFWDLRQSLLKEQGYLCCYCMRRVDLETDKVAAMKTEHFLPKSLYNGIQEQVNGAPYPNLTVDYNNLLAACDDSYLTCDSTKKAKELQTVPNPASKDFNTFKIRYISYITLGKESDRFVEIQACNKTAIAQATAPSEQKRLMDNDPLIGNKEGCLNLNYQKLKSRRGAIWVSIYKYLAKELGTEKDWHTSKGIRLAHEIIAKQDTKDESGRSPEFCQMVIDLLRKKFKL
ncbi:MAG: hypothetical protein JNM36_17915 [Chitinophagales bacterium]|nr:hypothetical protein [Chitinophagales bacterium]